MSERFRKVLAVSLAVVLALGVSGLAGCAKKTDEGAGGKKGDEPVKGGTLSFEISEPICIEPLNAQESEGVQVVNAVFDSLVDFDPKTMEIRPAAAESWESNEDATVWTFRLRKGAKFHNGREVKAEDFKYAWERICNPENKSEISYHLSAVKGYDEMQEGKAKELEGVKVLDDYTLQVTLKEPFGDFEYVVGHPALAPVPKEEVDTPEKAKAFFEKPIGNGPFKMAEPWKHNQVIKVVRFDDYYGAPAYLDGVDFKIYKDPETAFVDFEAGNLDFTVIPVGQVKATISKYGKSTDGYSVEPGKQVLTGAELAVYYLAINNKDKTFANKKLRQALSLAINRDAINESVFEGGRTVATGIVPKGIVGYQEGAWPYCKYDKEQAAKLLAEAGYPEGKGLPVISLGYNTEGDHQTIMQLVASDLKALGINTKLEGREWGQYVDSLQSGRYQIGRFGWVADYPIMDNFLYPLFESKSGDNVSGYSNPQVDALMKEARKTADADARIEKYREAERMIGEDSPVIPVVYYSHGRVGSNRIRGLVFSQMGLANLEKVWIGQ